MMVIVNKDECDLRDPFVLKGTIEGFIEKNKKRYSSITIANKDPLEITKNSASIYLRYKGGLPNILTVSDKF